MNVQKHWNDLVWVNLVTKFLLNYIDKDFKKNQSILSLHLKKNFLTCLFETKLLLKTLVYILKSNVILEMFKFISKEKISAEPK